MPDRDQIEFLFDRISEELADTARAEVELDIAQLRQFTRDEHEKIAVHFDLALEQLQDPSTQHRYLDLSQLAERRLAESTALNSALERFERMVQAPFQSKKPATASARSSYRAPLVRAAMRVVPAHPRDRLSALLIDTICSAAIALALTAAISPFVDASPLRALGVQDIPKLFEYVWLTALYLKIFLCVLIGYPILMLTTRGRTLGLSMRRIKLSSDSGTPPKAHQILIRSLLTPLSLLTLTPIAVIQGRKSLSDLLSRTTISRI